MTDGRLNAAIAPTIAAGDALIREVLAGAWPRQPRALSGNDIVVWRELRAIASSEHGEGSNKPRPGAGVPPPRPETRDGPPGGVDQGDQVADPWHIPPEFKREPSPAKPPPRKAR